MVAEMAKGIFRAGKYLSMDLAGHSSGLVGGINGWKEGWEAGRRSKHSFLAPLPFAAGGFLAKGGGNWLIPAIYKDFTYGETWGEKLIKLPVAFGLDATNLGLTIIGTGATFPVGHISGPGIKTGLNVAENALLDAAGVVWDRTMGRR